MYGGGINTTTVPAKIQARKEIKQQQLKVRTQREIRAYSEIRRLFIHCQAKFRHEMK
jgi:hypothetical protein